MGNQYTICNRTKNTTNKHIIDLKKQSTYYRGFDKLSDANMIEVCIDVIKKNEWDLDDILVIMPVKEGIYYRYHNGVIDVLV